MSLGTRIVACALTATFAGACTPEAGPPSPDEVPVRVEYADELAGSLEPRDHFTDVSSEGADVEATLDVTRLPKLSEEKVRLLGLALLDVYTVYGSGEDQQINNCSGVAVEERGHVFIATAGHCMVTGNLEATYIPTPPRGGDWSVPVTDTYIDFATNDKPQTDFYAEGETNDDIGLIDTGLSPDEIYELHGVKPLKIAKDEPEIGDPLYLLTRDLEGRYKTDLAVVSGVVAAVRDTNNRVYGGGANMIEILQGLQLLDGERALASPGDSGNVWVTEDLKAAGIHVAAYNDPRDPGLPECQRVDNVTTQLGTNLTTNILGTNYCRHDQFLNTEIGVARQLDERELVAIR